MRVTNTIAIGCYSHASAVPTSRDFMDAYETLNQIIRQIGLEPTWFGADDGKSRPQWKKFGGALHKKVLEAAGQGYRGVSLCVAPTEGTEPGYEKTVEASFTFSPESGDTIVEVASQEPHVILGGLAEMVIGKLASLWRWDYGFGLQRDSAQMPLTYLGGAISRTETVEERRRIEKWYATYQPEVRRTRVRDIFPYNIIGEGHLAQALPDGRSLHAFIRADPDSELRALKDDLWLWRVAPDRTEAVRAKLRGTGILISE